MDCSENNTGHAQYPALCLSHGGSWTHAARAGLEKVRVRSGLYGGPGGNGWSVGAKFTGWGVNHSFQGEQAARETQKHKRAAHPHLTPHIPLQGGWKAGASSLDRAGPVLRLLYAFARGT